MSAVWWQLKQVVARMRARPGGTAAASGKRSRRSAVTRRRSVMDVPSSASAAWTDHGTGLVQSKKLPSGGLENEAVGAALPAAMVREDLESAPEGSRAVRVRE